ncbi:TadE family protein [Stieleria neptunia]|uniref:TadE family protein n=1 Tax=Stieleria neptunia TaxID=2527979 RepID=UPI001E3D65D0|nr:TadE family protein [Stieleria neptunia]
MNAPTADFQTDTGFQSEIRPPDRARTGNRVGRRRRRGSAMVEFAIVAPLLFFFFFAAFEFCRVAMIRHTVDNAVYEGCRKAIVPGGTAADARSTANTVLGTLGLHGATVNVSPAQINNQTPELTVTIEVSLDANTFVPPQFTGGKKIVRTLTMKRETANL